MPPLSDGHIVRGSGSSVRRRAGFWLITPRLARETKQQVKDGVIYGGAHRAAALIFSALLLLGKLMAERTPAAACRVAGPGQTPDPVQLSPLTFPPKVQMPFCTC